MNRDVSDTWVEMCLHSTVTTCRKSLGRERLPQYIFQVRDDCVSRGGLLLGQTCQGCGVFALSFPFFFPSYYFTFSRPYRLSSVKLKLKSCKCFFLALDRNKAAVKEGTKKKKRGGGGGGVWNSGSFKCFSKKTWVRGTGIIWVRIL